jgi:hypothetical protein
VSPEEAERALGVPPRRLTADGLGPPAGPFVRSSAVSYVYGDGDADTVDLIFTQLRADLEQPLLRKVVGPDSSLRTVDLGGGRPGYWIDGAEHTVVFVERGNDVVAEPIRLAGQVLLWQEGNITYRLEGASLTEEQAVALARSAVT